MNSSCKTLGDFTERIKNELSSFYPSGEIQGFIHYIFDHFFGFNLNDIRIHKDKEITESLYLNIWQIIHQLKEYKPIQYIIGQTCFYDINLHISPGVFIPRPETEELADWIIKSHHDPETVFDLCTGSGCLAVALALHYPKTKVDAADISETALSVARKNAEQNHASVRFFTMDLLQWKNHVKKDFHPSYDLIVSNPPYVCESEKLSMLPNVLDHEPHEALFVPDDQPLVFYKAIAGFAATYLKDNGSLYVEINERFPQEVTDLLKSNGFKEITLKNDISGKHRMMRAVK